MKIADIGKEMLLQDDLATFWPLYCVEERERIYGMDPQYSTGNDWEWTSEDGDITVAPDDIEEQMRDDAPESYRIGSNPEDYGWERVYYVDRWRFVTAHFTMRAAEAYIEANRHNLRDPRVHVSSQNRCPEWQAVVKHLRREGA